MRWTVAAAACVLCLLLASCALLGGPQISTTKSTDALLNLTLQTQGSNGYGAMSRSEIMLPAAGKVLN